MNLRSRVKRTHGVLALTELIEEEEVNEPQLEAPSSRMRTGGPIDDEYDDSDDAKDQAMTVRAWKASYFATKTLAGPPAATGFQRALNVDWKMNAPVKEVKPGDFSVRWEAKVIAPETGTYVLGARANAKAGTRITVDGKLVMDNWKAQFPTPTGYGDSPYKSLGACAGNYYLIDQDRLADEGLLKKEEIHYKCKN